MQGLKVYLPELEDLWFRERLMSDEETMSYNHHWGGTIAFPEERWPEWYRHWISDHQNQRFYRYLVNEKRNSSAKSLTILTKNTAFILPTLLFIQNTENSDMEEKVLTFF